MCLKIINLLCVSICSVKQCIDAACFRTQYVGSSSTNVDFITFLESREERITIFEDKQGRDFNVKGVI